MMKKRHALIEKIIVLSLLMIWFVISIMPFLWTFLTSIKQPIDAFAQPVVWIFKPTLQAYKTLWIGGEFVNYFKNSMIISLSSVGIAVIFGSLGGYALARYTKIDSFIILFVALIFRALPRMVFILPYYYISRLTGLYDTKILLVLIMVSINQPFTIWMLRSFFMDIPESLEEAAMVDGCTRFQAFLRVIVPIMLPGVVTTSIFTLLLAYNEYMIPAVLTATKSITLPVAIAQFGAEDFKNWSVSAAGSISIALPIIIIVIFLQRYLIKGMTAGAVKG